MVQNKVLKKGYTTGVHTSFAFKSALECFLATKLFSKSKTNKMDNDDLDVTKGCEIIVSISDNKTDLIINDIKHQPYILKNKNNICEIYAGNGVGVVTKDGLKPPKNYPAINPVPLQSLDDIFQKIKINNLKIFTTIEVINGNEIAKQTANTKVGVLGGISILGTTGWVKPISATAYIHSIEQELNYAKVNNYKTIIFTLGNTAYKQTQNSENIDINTYIIEIGNFIYDGIILAVKMKFDTLELWLGIGKCVKIAQGFKNTHNRFGSIDFNLVQNDLKQDIKDCVTIKAVRKVIGDDCVEYDNLMRLKAQQQLFNWFNKNIKVRIW